MSPELTNLLPEERARELRSDYFYRLATAVVFIAVCTVAVHGAFLVPAYLHVETDLSTRTSELAKLEATAGDDSPTSATILAALARQTSAIASLGTSTPQSSLLTSTLAVPHPGISVTGIAAAAKAGKNPATVAVSGIAATRDALRSYNLALGALPFAKSADLPVSVYAVESKIPFTITIKLP
jgi:Tfp pilus assembly protein PilN